MANELKTEKKAQAVSLLCEGVSIRSVERVTGIHRDTVMRLGVRMGEACAKIQDERFRNLNCNRIEVDEIWGFIGKKQRNAKIIDLVKGRGDVWTFIGLDSETKLIPSWVVGLRDSYHSRCFMDDLASRMAKRVGGEFTGFGLCVQGDLFPALVEDPDQFGLPAHPDLPPDILRGH